MNVELYINNQLCDIKDPKDLGVKMKRLFIKPSELSSKDAQKSYEITLPATPNNNRIFRHVNIEETQGKFSVLDKAVLYIDSTRIFEGKFKLSRIGADYYSGNLGIPTPVTVKDIFGERNMNEAGEWLVPFEDVLDITKYNDGTFTDKTKYGNISPCIFPFVLHKLIGQDGSFAKDVFDESMKFTLDDSLPSVNCLHILKAIFKDEKYELGGSAMNDERLKNLYVSYKNPNEYMPDWAIGTIRLKGSWSNYNASSGKVENKSVMTKADYLLHTVNLFDAANSEIAILEDNRRLIIQDKKNNTTVLEVPHDGLYKISFGAEIYITRGVNKRYTQNGISVISHMYGNKNENFETRRFEIKVLRNNSDLGSITHDNVFFENNINQDPNNKNKEGYIFPKNGRVNFIDPNENQEILCGLAWGYNRSTVQYQNPAKDEVTDLFPNKIQHNPMALTGGKSWEQNNYAKFRGYSAVQSDGYYKRIDGVLTQTEDFKVYLKNAGSWTEAVLPVIGTGAINQIVWLNKGDKISIMTTSDDFYEEDNRMGWINQSINFDFIFTPFKKDKDWLKIDEGGASVIGEDMDWDDPSDFKDQELNLTSFLPSNVKINDWIDNFCKAFNLSLVNTGEKKFELNTKNAHNLGSMANIVDLDKKVNLAQRSNEPLGLPSAYQLGFTVDKNEQGYMESIKEIKDENGKMVKTPAIDGGGEYNTKSYDSKPLNQKSNFSYCWYKQLYNKERKELIKVPVITDKEIWQSDKSYEEVEKNRYCDKAQRFWYHSDDLFNIEIGNSSLNGNAKLAIVSNEYKGSQSMVLDYEDKPNSIMKNYFLLLVDSDNSYTTVQCHLTPEEYNLLGKCMVRFNGDLYYVAEVDGYDPLQQSKATMKLIRKII